MPPKKQHQQPSSPAPSSPSSSDEPKQRIARKPEVSSKYKDVNLQHNGILTSLFVSNGGQTVTGLENCIKSLLSIDRANAVVGLVELDSNSEDCGPLIPLELLQQSNELLDSNKFYRPHILFANAARMSEEYIPPSVQQPATSTQASSASTTTPAAPASNAVVPAENNQQWEGAQSSSWGPYGDPWQNFEYFHQYGKLTIHAEMIKDESRTKAYHDGIMMHAQDFKDKVVMDLGCGTGILSFFAARAGAKRVYAVEASQLADWTKQVVASNGLTDKIIVCKGKIEELQIPEQVDIILSEWMGTFLIFESMLESLLWARNKYLKKNGHMFPSNSSIYLVPVCMDAYYQQKVSFWAKQYEVDFSVLIPYAKQCAFEKPIIDHKVNQENVLAAPHRLASFDLKWVAVDKPYQETTERFSFVVDKDGTFHGFTAYFDVEFRGSDLSKCLVLSTAPECKDTHWHQMMLMFDNPIEVKKGYVIKGIFKWMRNPDLLRHLIFDVTYAIEPVNAGATKRFYLWGTE